MGGIFASKRASLKAAMKRPPPRSASTARLTSINGARRSEPERRRCLLVTASKIVPRGRLRKRYAANCAAIRRRSRSQDATSGYAIVGYSVTALLRSARRKCFAARLRCLVPAPLASLHRLLEGGLLAIARPLR